MLVIMRQGDWQLIGSPQTIAAAWHLADQLTEQTGMLHWVSRA